MTTTPAPVLADRVQCAGGGCRRGWASQPGLGLDESHEAGQDGGMVIYQDDVDHVLRWVRPAPVARVPGT